jgi:hypothetical protein
VGLGRLHPRQPDRWIRRRPHPGARLDLADCGGKPAHRGGNTRACAAACCATAPSSPCWRRRA